MCSTTTKAKLKGSGPDGEEFFIKTISNEEIMWTADNEAKALELAGNMPGIVKCYKIFDRRHLEGKEKYVAFVLKFAEGGYLEGWCTNTHKDGTYSSHAQFFKFAEQMLTTVSRLHTELFVLHTDLHFKNWILDKEENLILCDFGCAQVLGEGGSVPPGTKVFYADMHSGPEMRYEDGKSFLDAKTVEEFDFKGDVFQLGFTLQCVLAQGKWIMKNPTPTNYGKALVDFLAWMKHEDKHARPTSTQALARLRELKGEWEATRGLPFLPDPTVLFAGENLTPQHSKLREFRQAYDQFFSNEITAEEKEFHNQMDELRADGLPVEVDKDGFQGTYVGQFNRKGQFNGRGVLLQKRSLFEGFFKNGQKFGAGREIKLSFGSPYIKVIQGTYADGGIAQGKFTETNCAMRKEQATQTIVRTYIYDNGVIVEEQNAEAKFLDGSSKTGKLESMVTIKA